MRTSLVLLAVLVTSSALAQQPTWYLMSREEGCVEPKELVDLGIVERAPVSPEDYAQMLRSRGKKVTLGLPPGFPSEFSGKIVQIKVGGEDGGVAFATEEVCRKRTNRR
jgi:hypothetical protein